MNPPRARQSADVLVIGGGMSAAWAAIAASEAGARVIMADKGYVGTSGVTATGGPNHWWIPPDPALRREAVERRLAIAGGLAEPAWMERAIDLTWRHLPKLAGFYPFGNDGAGGTYFSGVRGPEYMRALRQFAEFRGVEILDHHPAIELLADPDGRIAGAHCLDLRRGEPVDIVAGAVIVATGGCALRSGLIGSHCNTGDGYLMAAEAGAELSGMEFSISFSLSPAWASTRTLPYFAARFFDESGAELDIPPPRAGHAHLQALGAALLRGTVLADLSDAPPALPPILHRIQPFTPIPFERRGINLFKDRFAVRLFGEGNIRGTGGLRLIDASCRTTVAGLYAVGDAASREYVSGAASGGGAVNAAWALSSGRIAGASAADEARTGAQRKTAPLNALGQVGLTPQADPRELDLRELAGRSERAVHAYDQALWRQARQLGPTRQRLDADWQTLARHGLGRGRKLLALRETAAMTATARWCTAAALARAETRGIHVRADFPESTARNVRRLLVGGLDDVWTRDEAVLPGSAG